MEFFKLLSESDDLGYDLEVEQIMANRVTSSTIYENVTPEYIYDNENTCMIEYNQDNNLDSQLENLEKNQTGESILYNI